MAEIPKWKRDMLEKKRLEEEARLQAERDRVQVTWGRARPPCRHADVQGQWLDNLVGEAEPAWKKALKAQKSAPAEIKAEVSAMAGGVALGRVCVCMECHESYSSMHVACLTCRTPSQRRPSNARDRQQARRPGRRPSRWCGCTSPRRCHQYAPTMMTMMGGRADIAGLVGISCIQLYFY